MNSQRTLAAESLRIYIVDDDPAVCNALKFCLEAEGFNVCSFSDPVKLLGDHDLATCGCLIVDMNLPHMSGLDLIDALRKQRISAPAILITTHPSNAVRQRAASTGVRLVEKPFLDDSLIEGVRDTFRGTSGERL